jgi:hypothetical protein
LAEIGILLLIWNCKGILIPVMDSIAESLFLLSADKLSTISYLQWTPFDMSMPHIFAYAAKTVFLLFKEQVPFE